ncbi:hypothetical protein [Fulvivirga sedimenti]|uniref:Uncharacterized protein n=1 Tax=Fulvivirga sedimenti TaxID=2879465 RepID=A0A9X1HQN6_9BACT|nr:hypothetical protein [Fulvivirga sedimenti]MCA6074869.1 hypothetical protein [Fulvivirga sedimenti]MCA6076046.1 hypothetical protein [Fulvivirga sedimenti]MCA6077174.1 hypothetical protein [Fulvivirga sedimenti]
MLSLTRKIRNIFVALFLCAWCISAVHLGKQHLKASKASKTEIESVIPSSTTAKSLENTSLLVTTFVGVIHYFYQK